MSGLAVTAAFICRLQVRTPGPSCQKEAYFIKIGPWSSHYHLLAGMALQCGRALVVEPVHHHQPFGWRKV